jgi:predicted DNA-binding transcriptional regulator YafY
MRSSSVLDSDENVIMPETSTASRLLALLGLLQTHRHWPGNELAGRLGVTPRTLRRDIERLRELGYRVESVPGVAGGYRLEAGSALPPLHLTDDEAVTMAIGLRIAAAQGLEDGTNTTLTALAKLEQVLPPALRARVGALGEVLSPSRRPSAAVAPELLGRLALACRDRERIRFAYVSGGGDESRRIVEPHSLVAAERAWFLVGWDLTRSDWRTFRVDRLSDLFLTRLHFPERALPADDAAEFVAVAASSIPQPRTAVVVMDLPLDRVREHFGPWARGAEPAGDGRTAWPIGGRSNEELMSALAWIPEGVEYEVRGDPEFARFLGEVADRMHRASAARPQVAPA